MQLTLCQIIIEKLSLFGIPIALFCLAKFLEIKAILYFEPDGTKHYKNFWFLIPAFISLFWLIYVLIKIY